ncbi:multicomponent Na+:H+ antiporter subunit E [Virgibacillus halotolerans]|uniref:Na+/H+ antiporter subunit E n=1 Tax=Virgibacillus halotolerans TaxID=1071053 RepID=UPI001961B879|nr:Na+/H+ antiporter subunit E [Virgibacillus halotolerans]MBM7599545.1 multicomponent Na+:H+ antiporter subunit E [Virgibacillus halotolerans]
MAFQILLNFVIAVTWMLLSSSMTAQTFIIGYLIGLLIIFIMRRYFRERFYLGWAWAAVKLALIFLRELTMSNITVLLIVLNPKMDIRPAFFAFPTDLQKDWEIMLLSNLITLTPGTLVVHVSDDQRTLYIHAIDVDDVDNEIQSIKHSFEKAIREVGQS